MVRIARFADVTEAQVVASALKSAGIHVFLQNEHTGQVDFLWQQALGGFGIMVPQEDAKAAAVFIRQHRASATQQQAAADVDGPTEALAYADAWAEGPPRRGLFKRWAVVILMLGPMLAGLGSCVIQRFTG